jgi:predicted ribosome quality control (RQC) complex YloA/Tae2 family protein
MKFVKKYYLLFSLITLYSSITLTKADEKQSTLNYKNDNNKELEKEIEKIHYQIKHNESQINQLVKETAELKTKLVHINAKRDTIKAQKSKKFRNRDSSRSSM